MANSGKEAMRKTAADINYVEDKHRAIHERLINWGRWAEDRPIYQTCPMFKKLYRSSSRQWHPIEVRDHIDPLDAAVLEKAVVALPAPHRRAMVWFYVFRGSELAFRRQEGYRQDFLCRVVRDARQMLCNRLAQHCEIA